MDKRSCEHCGELRYLLCCLQTTKNLLQARFLSGLCRKSPCSGAPILEGSSAVGRRRNADPAPCRHPPRPLRKVAPRTPRDFSPRSGWSGHQTWNGRLTETRQPRGNRISTSAGSPLSPPLPRVSREPGPLPRPAPRTGLRGS